MERNMSDLISRKKAFDMLSEYYHHRLDFQHLALREALSRVPSEEPNESDCWGCNCPKMERLNAEPERKIYAKMSDEEFEKWLHDNGICNPNIHESIPCSCVPLLIDSAINELPSAEPQWIPVSERLPDDWEDVLVWFEYFRYGDYNRMYSTYGIGNYSNRYDSWLINHETGWTDLHVFAWMPLPEPPKMEGEQDG